MMPILPARQRALLAALLVNANRVVPIDELTQAIWGQEPPVSARSTLRNYVKRLRQTLATCGQSRIITVPGGYQIRVAAEELDVLRFEALWMSARHAAADGAWSLAAGQLSEALALWTGEPLADVPSEWLALREVPRLAEMRLQAVEARAEADLRLGRHVEVIVELRQMVAVHPLRERLHALLMLALYRDGQQAGALSAYQHARGVLQEELGAEPGPELQRLQQQILASDPVLAVPAAGQAAGAHPGPPSAPEPTAWAEPQQLPPTVRHFTGRHAELAALTRMSGSHASGRGPAVVIPAISGTAGVGKTALAVHWAHLAAERFPDGQLYVNLRGYDPGEPMAATDALAGFLRALGVRGAEIPPEIDERAALYRSMLAGRRMLVLLDNARSADQLRPLLPGTAGCVAVVTSRDSLPGLVARDGAERLELDPLPLADAVEVLRTGIGARVAAEQEAAETLARQCSMLPLALRLAAELAAAHPAVPLAELVAELADQRQLLDRLDAGGDARTAVRAVFSWSVRYLDADYARAFWLLGLHPGDDYDRYAAAALTGGSLERAGLVLEQLALAHLIQPISPSRYGMHDLLRAYAREMAAVSGSEHDTEEALTRLLDHYLAAAAAAMDVLFPAGKHDRTRVGPSAAYVPPLADAGAARHWLDSHRANLVAVAAYGADNGRSGYATSLAATTFRYLEGGGHYPELVAIYVHARRSAKHAGDRAAEAEALHNVSVVDLRQGRYDQAISHLEQALHLHRDCGDQVGQARALGNLGIAAFLQGRYQRASGYQQQARALYRAAADKVGESRTLTNLGLIELRQGRYQHAAEQFSAALSWFRQNGPQTSEAYAIGNLGVAELRLGDDQQATAHLRQSLTLFRELADPTGEAYALTNLAGVDLRQGRHRQAAERCRQAQELSRKTGNRAGEADALNGTAEVLLATNAQAGARTSLTSALNLASQISDKYEQARAHNGLARSYHATSDSDRASQHWRQALTLYTELGAPESDEVRAHLARLTDPREPNITQP
jgi:DNA-binding SARP family transcriptional activator/Tfp pilus assembly protein PilF